MKKFFVALAILLCTWSGTVNADPTEFTDEQKAQILSIVTESNAAPLKLDVATFQKNFDDYMNGVIADMNTGDDADKLRQLLLIGEPNVGNFNGRAFFLKSFMNVVAIAGTVDDDGKFDTLNFFATKVNDQKDALVHVLILHAFIKGIAPDQDATALLNEVGNSPDATVVKGNVKFSFVKNGSLNTVSATAN